MLYAEAKQYLVDKLVAAGVKSKPYTTQKALEKSMESHIGAVLFDKEEVTRNGSKRIFRDEAGARMKRSKAFDRTMTFTVIIGGYSDEEVETIFEKFLGSLDQGIYVDGNFVPIEPGEADWVSKDDSILKAQVAVQISIVFQGGLYVDTGFTKIAGVEVEDIAKVKE